MNGNLLTCTARDAGYGDDLVQDGIISIAKALEILQSCTKPSMCISD